MQVVSTTSPLTQQTLSLFDKKHTDFLMCYQWSEEANHDAKVSLSTEEGLRVAMWKVLLGKEEPKEDANAWKPEYNSYNQIENVDTAPKTISGQQLFGAKQGETWVVILVHGGYFSIGIFKAGTLIRHKTCHRYVTRRKNGGRQSSKDNSGNKGRRPQSAGANIRRFNEEKHRIEIEETLKRWQHEVRTADMVFIHAPGPVNRKLLFFEGSPLLDDDHHHMPTHATATTTTPSNVTTSSSTTAGEKKKRCICNVPFTTGRPNTTEVVRVFEQLATVEIEHTTPSASATGSTL